MIWGDQHEPRFFDYFCEKSIMATFVRILEQSTESVVKVQVIQTLSILVANTRSTQVSFYLLSNNYVNDLIVYPFNFNDDEELLSYYISFLKTLSMRLDSQTIIFLFNEHASDFPLYNEAIKFFRHPEAMVRIAVRTLSLNVYKIDYPPLRKYLMEKAVVPYFFELGTYLREQSLHLDTLLSAYDKDEWSHQRPKAVKSAHVLKSEIADAVEKQVDTMYYLQDIFNTDVKLLTDILADQVCWCVCWSVCTNLDSCTYTCYYYYI
jgi:protein CLEC16A